MNKNFTPLVIGVTLVLVSLISIIGVLSSAGNAVANIFIVFNVLFAVIGVFTPKAGIYLAILSTAYLDLVKRFMIFDVYVSYSDLYYVLGVTPILVGSIYGSVVMKGLFNWGSSTYDSRIKLLFTSLVLLVVVGVTEVAFGSSRGNALSDFANGAIYLTLIYSIPILFSTPREYSKLIKFTLIAYIPVTLYMFKQAFFGLFDFEYDYLLSGLTMEVRILYDHQLRLFSTMNGAANASTVLSLLGVAWLAAKPESKRTFMGLDLHPGKLLGAVLFFWAAYYTLSRGGWLCGFGAFIGLFILRRKSTAVISAAGLGIVIVILAFNGKAIQESGGLVKATEFLQKVAGGGNRVEGTSAGGMATRLGTFEGRLDSLYLTATDGRRWTPFGLAAQGINAKESRQNFADESLGDAGARSPYYSHDGFSDILMRIGYIPLFLVGVIGFVVFNRTLNHLKFARRCAEGRLYITSLSLTAGVFVGYIANPAQIRVFPTNVFLYLFVSGIIVYLHWLSQKTKENAREAVIDAEGATGGATSPANASNAYAISLSQ